MENGLPWLLDLRIHQDFFFLLGRHGFLKPDGPLLIILLMTQPAGRAKTTRLSVLYNSFWEIITYQQWSGSINSTGSLVIGFCCFGYILS